MSRFLYLVLQFVLPLILSGLGVGTLYVYHTAANVPRARRHRRSLMGGILIGLGGALAATAFVHQHFLASHLLYPLILAYTLILTGLITLVFLAFHDLIRSLKELERELDESIQRSHDEIRQAVKRND